MGRMIYDVMAAILDFKSNEMSAMLVCQTNPVRDELFSYVKQCSDCWTRECIRSISVI